MTSALNENSTPADGHDYSDASENRSHGKSLIEDVEDALAEARHCRKGRTDPRFQTARETLADGSSAKEGSRSLRARECTLPVSPEFLEQRPRHQDRSRDRARNPDRSRKPGIPESLQESEEQFSPPAPPETGSRSFLKSATYLARLKFAVPRCRPPETPFSPGLAVDDRERGQLVAKANRDLAKCARLKNVGLAFRPCNRFFGQKTLQVRRFHCRPERCKDPRSAYARSIAERWNETNESSPSR